MNGAIYVKNTKNTKLVGTNGRMDSTYVNIKDSCPSTCELKESGCYTKTSFVGMIVRRLERQSLNTSPLKLARAEAKAIDQSYNGKNVPTGTYLRLHVSGDTRVIKGARILNKAVGRWLKRNGHTAYSYTHAWRHIHRNEWNNVSILASIDKVEEAKQAKQNGYACAIVIPEHLTDRAFKIEGSDISWLPCPAQTKEKVSCSSCKLCMKADWLFTNNKGIAFAAHGINKSKIKRRLTILQ